MKEKLQNLLKNKEVKDLENEFKTPFNLKKELFFIINSSNIPKYNKQKMFVRLGKINDFETLLKYIWSVIVPNFDIQIGKGAEVISPFAFKKSVYGI